MSVKIITALAAAVLIGSTAMASAQTRAFPRDNYWNDGFYGPSVNFGIGVSPHGPGYYDYAPGYYGYGYAPGSNCGVTGCNWNDGW